MEWIVRTCILFLIWLMLGSVYAGTSYAAKQSGVASGSREAAAGEIAVIYGKVLNMEALPVEGAILTYTVSNTDGESTVITERDGSYRIVVHMEERKWVRINVRGEADGYVSAELYSAVIYSGENKKLNFWLNKPSTVIGTVTNKAGEPVAGAEVVAFGWSSEKVNIKTDSDGKFEFVIPEISYDWPIIWVQVNSEDYLPYEVDYYYIVAGGTTRMNIELRDAAHLRGRVLDEDGNPINAVKLLSTERTPMEIATTTDEEGNYVLKRLPLETSIYVDGAGYIKQMVKVDLVAGDNNRIDFVLVRDTTAPVTKYRLEPIKGSVNGKSYIKGFVFRLLAEDEDYGSGIKITKYRFNGGEWITYARPVNFYAPDVKKVEYYSTDIAGNEEVLNIMDFVKGTFQGAENL